MSSSPDLGRVTVHLAHQRPDLPGFSGMTPRKRENWMLLFLLDAHRFRCPLGTLESKTPVLYLIPPEFAFAVEMKRYRHYSAHFSEATYHGWRETNTRAAAATDSGWPSSNLRENPETLRIADAAWRLFEPMEYRTDVLAAFDRLVAAYQTGDRFRTLVALLALLERSVVPKTSDEGARLRRFADHLAFRGNRPASVAMLAKDCGMSRVHLHRLCMRVYGVAPKELLMRERIAVSCRALELGASVNAAAAASGFQDAYYFSRIFTRLQGIPPSRWAGRAR